LKINIDTTKKNTETFIYACNVTLEANSKKTKYMLLSHHQNAGRNHDVKIADGQFENAVQLKYFGMTVTNQNLIQWQIKRRQNSGNAKYHSI
jgi:hypothetical protein